MCARKKLEWFKCREGSMWKKDLAINTILSKSMKNRQSLQTTQNHPYFHTQPRLPSDCKLLTSAVCSGKKKNEHRSPWSLFTHLKHAAACRSKEDVLKREWKTRVLQQWWEMRMKKRFEGEKYQGQEEGKVEVQEKRARLETYMKGWEHWGGKGRREKR